MTVILMLLFICTLFLMSIIVRKVREYKLAPKNVPFVHDNGLLPTMADGGEPVKKEAKK